MPLIFIWLFSCGEKENGEKESNVYTREHNYTVEDKLLNARDVSLKHYCEITLTLSEEDNCTYFVFKEKYHIKGNEGWFGDEKPKIDEMIFMDDGGNLLYTFDPKVGKEILIDDMISWRGKVPKYYKKEDNLTPAKFRRLKTVGLKPSYTVYNDLPVEK